MLEEFYLFDWFFFFFFFSLSFLVVQVRILSCTVCLWLYIGISVLVYIYMYHYELDSLEPLDAATSITALRAPSVIIFILCKRFDLAPFSPGFVALFHRE